MIRPIIGLSCLAAAVLVVLSKSTIQPPITSPFRREHPINREWWCCLWLFLSAIACQAENSAPNISDALDKMAHCRDQIKTYHLKIQVTSTTTSSGDKNSKPNRERRVLEIWSNGTSLRRDSEILDNPRLDQKQIGRSIDCFDCERKGFVTQSFQHHSSMGAITFDPMTAERLKSDGLSLDWPRLGLTSAYTNAITIENEAKAVFGSAATGVSFSILEDGAVFRLKRDYQKMNRKTTSYTVDLLPAEGFNPRSIAWIPAIDDQGLRQSMDATYRQDSRTSIWFPSRLRYIVRSNGEVIREDLLVFEEVELNVTIPDVVFTVEGFNLRSQTPVFYPEVKDPRKAPTIQDGKLDYDRSFGKTTQEAMNLMLSNGDNAPVPTRSPSWLNENWPYLLAGLLTLVAIACLRIRRRS